MARLHDAVGAVRLPRPAAVVAWISLEEYSGARFRTLGPLALAATRSGSTQAFGHSRQVGNH